MPRHSSATGPIAAWLALTLLSPLGATAAEDGGRTGRVLAADGTAIVYTIEGSGPPVVFLHGWSCDRTYWREQLPVFAKKHTVVAIDLPGHGESSAARSSWTLEQLGEDAAAVVRELGLRDVILVGHSMGGPVALEAARRLGGAVAGVIGVDSLHDAGLRYDPNTFATLLDAYRKDFPGTCRAFVGSMFLPGTDAALVSSITADMCQAPPDVALALLAQFPEYDMAAAMRAVTAPIRSINAASLPTAIESNRKYSPTYDAIVLDGVGHFLQLEAPARFNDALAKTIDSLGRTTP